MVYTNNLLSKWLSLFDQKQYTAKSLSNMNRVKLTFKTPGVSKNEFYFTNSLNF